MKSINDTRKLISKENLNQAMSDIIDNNRLNDSAMVIYHDSMHVGVVGIVASKIKENFNRPTIIFGDANEEGFIKGSGRSIPSFNLKKALDEISSNYPEILGKYGGHSQAAGLSIRAEDLDLFRDELSKIVARDVSAEDLINTIEIDFSTSIQHVNKKFTDALSNLAPFGQSFQKVNFLIKNVVFILEGNNNANAKLMGITKDHLKIEYPNLEILSWFAGPHIRSFNKEIMVLDLVGNLKVNSNGKIEFNVDPRNIIDTGKEEELIKSLA